RLGATGFQRLETRNARHLHIQKHEVRHLVLQGLEQCLAGFERGDAMLTPGQTFDERGADRRLIVGDEDRGVHAKLPRESGPGRSGSQSRAVVPWPGSLVRIISPPWASAIFRQMARPSPVPCFFPVVKNG